MNILFCRLVKKVNRLFPLFVFFSLLGQAINVSEMAHKITKKKKTDLMVVRASGCYAFDLQIVSDIYHTHTQKNGKQGAISRCLKICFLHFSSISFSTYFKETKFIARKVDI